jgi:endonuclease/exonuclease/phosphatase (EEP) superfamily protein YafD
MNQGRRALWTAALSLPLGLRALSLFASLGGPWTLIIGVVGPGLALVAAPLCARLMWRARPAPWWALLLTVNLGVALEDCGGGGGNGSGHRVMTWNVALATGERLDCVARRVRAERPGLLAVQEVRQKELDELASKTDMACTWVGYFSTHSGNGLGLCSAPGWRVDRPRQRRFRDFGYAYQFAEVTAPHGALFNVINTHLQSVYLSKLQRRSSSTPSLLAHTAAQQTRQLLEMVRVGDHLRDPLLLMGDFNSTPNTWVHERLRRRFSDAHRATGTGLGWTRWLFDLLPARIDYLYAGRGMSFVGATRSDPSACSDHSPVVSALTAPKTASRP